MHTHRWAGPLDTMKRKRASTVTKQRTRVFFFFSHALHQWLIFRLLSTANGGQLTGCPSTERESISYDSYVLLRVAVRPIHSQPYRREYKRPITNPLEVFSSLFPPFIRLLFATGKKSRRHSTGARTDTHTRTNSQGLYVLDSAQWRLSHHLVAMEKNLDDADDGLTRHTDTKEEEEEKHKKCRQERQTDDYICLCGREKSR